MTETDQLTNLMRQLWLPSNYRLVEDEEMLKEFLEWLPELKDGERFYVSVFSRKKYTTKEGIKSDKGQLARFCCTKENLLEKLRKRETKLGTYLHNGVEVPQEALAVYITPNPRDMHKAALRTASEITKMMADGKQIYNPHALALNQIQVTGKKVFFDVDLDFTEEGHRLGHHIIYNEFMVDVKNINKEALTFVQTRGGFHILVELDKIETRYKKSWYNSISNLKSDCYTVMMNGDNMIPLPGCVQGGYVPSLII